MVSKKLLVTALLGMLLSIFPQSMHANRAHEIRTMGLVTAGVLITWGGVHLISRQNHGLANKIFDVLAGLSLIGAGVTGIVLSGQISKEIERAFR